MVWITGTGPGGRVWISGAARRGGVWELAGKQHNVVSRPQLRELGYSKRAIEHRLAAGRLHRLYRGVYAVGTPRVTQYGWWIASVLACSEQAAISHQDALALWDIRPKESGLIHVSVPRSCRSRPPGIVVHSRGWFGEGDVRRRHRIPVTIPAVTIVDIAAGEPERQLERVINEADQRGVIRFDVLRRELERISPRPGLARVTRLIERHTFRLTRSELERLFLPIARSVGLPVPETRAIVNGFEVDFWFPELGLVVEADSLTYHRTPAKQAQDRIRDQTHMAHGLWPLRFTHWQIAKQRSYVEETLAKVAGRLQERTLGDSGARGHGGTRSGAPASLPARQDSRLPGTS